MDSVQIQACGDLVVIEDETGSEQVDDPFGRRRHTRFP
jgi:hypothetical protein